MPLQTTGNTSMKHLTLLALLSLTATCFADELVKPMSVRKVVSDGRHNAFAAFTKWKGQYWLAFRKGTGHVSRDGDMFILRSKDTKKWHQSGKFDIFHDDRDAQLLATKNRLFLYINSLGEGRFDAFVTYTDDGIKWSKPKRVYRKRYILWKPVEYKGKFYAGSHMPSSIPKRNSHLIVSEDGIEWKKVSTIRAGRGESETTLLFGKDGKLTAFLRSQIKIGGFIMESQPPYQKWTERPAFAHLSGQVAYRFNNVDYVISRMLKYDPPVSPLKNRSAGAGRKLDQATMIYTYEGGKLKPYCRLGALDGNKDSSYAGAIQEGNTMLLIYHRAAHVFGGEFRAKDAADIYMARVKLKR